MTRARKELIAVEDTPYYHCISRCVRRAYLCGEDDRSHKNFDHRKRWLVERFKFLSSVFAIDICAYAVMSNHYHLVLFINQEQAESWSDQEVFEKWGVLFPASSQQIKDLLENTPGQAAQKLYQQKIEQWRENLSDISWFMRSLNEYIARKANQEDQCTGRFWEGRFKSQALLDEKALLSCMAYVDLNPVRAKMAATPETSDFTSIQERLYHQAKRQSQSNKTQTNKKKKQLIKHYEKHSQNPATQQNEKSNQPQAKLKPLQGSSRLPLSMGIPYRPQDYFQLVDWTGRQIRPNKRGAIDESLPPILKRLGLEAESWLESVTKFQQYFFHAAGSVSSMEKYQRKQNQKRAEQKQTMPIEWIKGKGASKRLYG